MELSSGEYVSKVKKNEIYLKQNERERKSFMWMFRIGDYEIISNDI